MIDWIHLEWQDIHGFLQSPTIEVVGILVKIWIRSAFWGDRIMGQEVLYKDSFCTKTHFVQKLSFCTKPAPFNIKGDLLHGVRSFLQKKAGLLCICAIWTWPELKKYFPNPQSRTDQSKSVAHFIIHGYWRMGRESWLSSDGSIGASFSCPNPHWEETADMDTH
jgi:hypothetical protein